ncbi:cytochrome C biogenesis protein CcmI [Methylocucumis oryzae]|uniref:Cytochrome C biogenesis protein CcmI n=2 Tax=Methylocucumis oryzae TaxID=1632867 RepID=A0A0F3ILM8_9GAMM|nr:cytochrome C biogenesis protein CcmI [Methylocucumis oryzae]
MLLLPLIKVPKVNEINIAEQNIAIAKSQLQELKQQKNAGVLSDDDYQQQRQELELSLADDLAVTKVVEATQTQGRWLMPVLCLAIPAFSLLLYSRIGDFQALEPTPEMLAQPKATPSAEDINRMVAKLAERMKTDPDNAEGWYMLGKSYKYLQQFPKAADAYAHAYQLLGERSDVMLEYAEVLALANHEQFSGKPAELVLNVLAREPDNVSALWFGGVVKAQAGQVPEAIKLWQKLYDLLPKDSEAQQQVKAMLASVNATPGAGTSEPVPPKESKVASEIHLSVAIAAELKTKVSANDTVFIYAQAVSGPKMPLAVVRKTAAELPIQVVLSDALAMSPMYKLSMFPDVKLIARVSKTGNAVSAPGDLIGTIESVSSQDSSPHSLLINSVVK